MTTADVAKVRAAVTAAGGTLVSRPADEAHTDTCPIRTSACGTRPSRRRAASTTRRRRSGATTGIPSIPRQAVHNLEHGGVAIWYGPDISAADRAALDAFYEEDENGLIITPIPDPYPGVTYPKHDELGSKIALTVWTAPEGDVAGGTVYIATLPSFDQEAFAAFRDTFRGKGPERFPVSQMVPGGN